MTKIIDVRTPAEFAGGHCPDAINIPLNEIPVRMDEIRVLAPAAIILCCASGNRSGQAVAYLQKQGISCKNGGAWTDIL